MFCAALEPSKRQAEADRAAVEPEDLFGLWER
jgi:hypothetical protein